ncbi:class I SAM-dependent methyltransferase [Pseudomonadota bacterium]
MNENSKAVIIGREFDALAGQYESNRLAPWYKAHADEVLKICAKLPINNVLDVGCGTAYLLRQLCTMQGKIKAVGMDLSAEMISNARSKAEAEKFRNLKFIHADWEALDDEEWRKLKEVGFNLIVCANTLHYFEDPHVATQKFYELLVDGGRLIILERDKSSSPLTFLWGFLHRYLIKDQVEFYTQSELIQIFKEVGFRSVAVTRSIRRYFWKGKMFTSIALLNCEK